MRIRNKKKEMITASAMLIFSLVYLYGNLGIKLGTARNPGAGFLPLLVGLGLLVCSCLYLYKVVRQPQTTLAVLDEEEPVKERQILLPAGIAAVVLVYPFLLRHLYFILTTALCLLVLLRLLRFKGWLFSLLAAIAITVVTYLLFFRVGVLLPSGAVEQFFFSLGR
jgi:hypothetical protein